VLGTKLGTTGHQTGHHFFTLPIHHRLLSANRHNFAVVLVKQSEAGTEIKEAYKAMVWRSNNGKWQVW
jgi:hypothetical protein